MLNYGLVKSYIPAESTDRQIPGADHVVGNNIRCIKHGISSCVIGQFQITGRCHHLGVGNTVFKVCINRLYRGLLSVSRRRLICKEAALSRV